MLLAQMNKQNDLFDRVGAIQPGNRQIDLEQIIMEKTTKEQAFWDWIDQCPEGVYVNHDFTDDEDEQKIHVFGFAVPKEGAEKC